MDFLARSRDDEFLAVLPSASKQMSREVVARIGSAFFETPLKISEQDSIELMLNVGSATLGEDGETPEQLIAAARLHKQAAKLDEPIQVLWFPTDGPSGDALDIRG